MPRPRRAVAPPGSRRSAPGARRSSGETGTRTASGRPSGPIHESTAVGNRAPRSSILRVPDRLAAGRRGRGRLRVLDVAGADLVDPRVLDLRRPREVAVGPDQDPLRADLDVDPRVVPVERPAHELRRMQLLRRRQLLARLARVAVAVRRQIILVDDRRALDEDLDPARDPGSGRVGEEQRDTRRAAGVVGLLRVPEPGRDVDRRRAVVVERRQRPGDRLPARVDRRQLRRDEALERLAGDVGRLEVTRPAPRPRRRRPRSRRPTAAGSGGRRGSR